MVTTMDFLAILTLVGKESCLLFLQHRSNVNVVSRMKAHGLGAEIHFAVIELAAAPVGEPAVRVNDFETLLLII
jgi:hypothetical protein